jgi:hypothetical protein
MTTHLIFEGRNDAAVTDAARFYTILPSRVHNNMRSELLVRAL